MQREYQSLKEGKNRVSVAQLRKSERKSAGDDKRRTTEIDEKIKMTFEEKQEITFADFLKWKTETVILLLKNTLSGSRLEYKALHKISKIDYFC